MRFFCLSLCLFALACGPNDEQSSLSRQRSKQSESVRPSHSDSLAIKSSPQDHSYPQTPELATTPGSKCTRADEYRYPEKIAYCRRSVSSGTKNHIISQYDRKFGYHIEDMRRNEFKIDHFIPLCMGGSNNQNNLWPQHESIYPLTDPVEARLCDMLASGRIKQAFAIDRMIWVKFHLDQAKAFLKDLRDVQDGKTSVAEFTAKNSQRAEMPKAGGSIASEESVEVSVKHESLEDDEYTKYEAEYEYEYTKYEEYETEGAE